MATPDARVNLEVRATIVNEADVREFDLAVEELASVAERIEWERELHVALQRLRRVRSSFMPRVTSEQ